MKIEITRKVDNKFYTANVYLFGSVYKTVLDYRTGSLVVDYMFETALKQHNLTVADMEFFAYEAILNYSADCTLMKTNPAKTSDPLFDADDDYYDSVEVLERRSNDRWNRVTRSEPRWY